MDAAGGGGEVEESVEGDKRNHFHFNSAQLCVCVCVKEDAHV